MKRNNLFGSLNPILNGIVIIFAILMLFNCSNNDKNPVTSASSVPILSTADVTVITYTTARSGGTITSDGGATVTARGVCWSTAQTPTVSDNKTTDGTGTGSFTSDITGLIYGTTYYVRAYATNSAGTGYGSVKSFTTLVSSGTVTDVDGNIYQTVTIGTQVWMAENLKVTHYRNGDDILTVTNDITFSSRKIGIYYNYNNDVSNVTTYGRLYNFSAVQDNRNISPEGWHVPTDTEWYTLINFLGMEVASDKMKEIGNSHWHSPNNSTNESGFTALPGGERYSDGVYNWLGISAEFWSSTDYQNGTYGWSRELIYDDSRVHHNYSARALSFSVRCVKD